MNYLPCLLGRLFTIDHLNLTQLFNAREMFTVQPDSERGCGQRMWFTWLVGYKPALVLVSVDASGFWENSDGRSAVLLGRAFAMACLSFCLLLSDK